MSGKDYYEILGVRPNAGREEIELAYKGRRSQYHPDRYAQSDAETHAWATAKMQEINEAYQIVSNSELRAKFDQRRSGGFVGRPPGQEHASYAQESRDAASILLNMDWGSDEKVYARPDIPRKKLEGAIASYAPGVSPDDVIVLLDDTLFGGAKEGLLVTSEALYCKQKFESPRRMALKSLKEVAPGTDCRVMVNGFEFFKADLISHSAILGFAARLSEVFEQPQPSPDSHGPRSSGRSGASGVDDLWVLHRGAMAALRTEHKNETLRIDDLIDRQMRCVANRFPDLYSAAENRRRSVHGHGSVDDVCAESALMIFLVLHYYGFSKLPTSFKEEVGDMFTRLHEFSEMYKTGFREGFPLVYGRAFDADEQVLRMLSAMFLHRDGSGEFELKKPREEVLLLLLTELGFQREGATTLMRQFEDLTGAWLESMVNA